jgi:hypothetical protein
VVGQGVQVDPEHYRATRTLIFSVLWDMNTRLLTL